MIEAGANAIVAGSAVFKAKSYKDGEWLWLAQCMVCFLKWAWSGRWRCRLCWSDAPANVPQLLTLPCIFILFFVPAAISGIKTSKRAMAMA